MGFFIFSIISEGLLLISGHETGQKVLPGIGGYGRLSGMARCDQRVVRVFAMTGVPGVSAEVGAVCEENDDQQDDHGVGREPARRDGGCTQERGSGDARYPAAAGLDSE